GPLSREHKANKQKHEQHTASKLEVDLLVLLVDLREAGECEALPVEGVGEHHEEAANDRKIPEEEVQIEDESITERLSNYHTEQSTNGVVRALSSNDESGARQHGHDVEEEEHVGDSPRNWNRPCQLATSCLPYTEEHTVSVGVEIAELVRPLSY